MEPLEAARDLTHRVNVSGYFKDDGETISRGSIISMTNVFGINPEAIAPFTYLFITDRVLIWDKMFAIFQGTDTRMYLNPSKKHREGRMGYNIIYNHYLGQSNIYHIADGVKKKLAQFTYTEDKRNWTCEKYSTLHKDENNLLESLMDHGYTGINQIPKVR